MQMRMLVYSFALFWMYWFYTILSHLQSRACSELSLQMIHKHSRPNGAQSKTKKENLAENSCTKKVHLNLRVCHSGAEDKATNAAETVNAHLCRHLEGGEVACPSELEPRTWTVKTYLHGFRVDCSDATEIRRILGSHDCREKPQNRFHSFLLFSDLDFPTPTGELPKTSIPFFHGSVRWYYWWHSDVKIAVLRNFEGTFIGKSHVKTYNFT